jgi:exosortase F-associated protein
MKRYRMLIGLLSLTGLVIVFLFQRLDVATMLGVGGADINRFLVNRTVRFLLNDAFAIGLIYALFMERKYVIFALYVQAAGVVLFLIPYFVLKLYFQSYNGPLISFLHRIILNPTLLMLLIPAFYYQRYLGKGEG